MLRVLPHLSDEEKLILFGEDLSVYTLVLTHKSCILIKVSLRGFHAKGCFSVIWSSVLKREFMANTIARYILWAKGFLTAALRFKKALSGAPKYAWMPLSEYTCKFPLELPDPTSTTAVSYQSLTNPVLHANNDRVYRMYKHYLCNTQNSQVEVLFEKLQRIAIQRRLDLEKKRGDLEKKRADMLQIILNGGSEDQLTGAKNTLEAIKRDLEGFMDLTTPSHPLTGWELNFPFLSMPFCGPTVHHAMKSMPATPERVKALLLSLLNSSLLPLEAAKTAHMDLRRQNICLRNSIETWADAIVIDLDFCVDYSKNTENPMDTTIPQYPPETI
ncbi:UNVERIFIED_CONTAM: hypothetical protein HDU68_007022, partial [Siphonaria sp. JEL0065]